MTDISARLRGEKLNWLGEVDIKLEAADHIDAQAKRIADLEAAIKRQAGAAKTLRQHTLSEVQHLKDKDRTEYIAGQTLDSERAANAMLTDEIDAQAAKIKALVEALEAITYETDDGCIFASYQDDVDLTEFVSAALAAAKERRK